MNDFQTPEEALAASILADDEVKKRLRMRNQPICYFGETAQDRRVRLEQLEKVSEVSYENDNYSEEKRKFLETKKRLQEEDAALKLAAQTNYANMSESEKRMAKLKSRLNEARKSNLNAVLHESKQRQAKEKDDSKPFFKNKKRLREEANDADITAEDAERLDYYKKKKQRKNPEAHEATSNDTLFKAYTKRTKSIDVNALEDYEKRKMVGKQNDALESIPESNVDRMVGELNNQIEKRSKYSRHRRNFEEEDITSINQHNLTFNKKSQRFFAKYTTEIKENLERGTAV